MLDKLPDIFELIEELPDRYIVTNKEGEQGNRLILFKVKTKEIEKSHQDEIEKAIKVLDKEEVTKLFHTVKSLQKNPPSVIEYNDVAINITKILKKFYDKIGSPNIFHHSIKQIDPNIYGRAQTFIHQMEILKNILKEIIATEN